MCLSEKLDSLHHVAINVSNLEQSLRWYTTSWRCEVVYEDATQAVLQFRNIRLALVLPSQSPPHLGFERQDAHTVGELSPNRDGTWSTLISDPTGNVIEILAPTEHVEVE